MNPFTKVTAQRLFVSIPQVRAGAAEGPPIVSTFRYQNSTRPLTLRQQRFLAAYQGHGNASHAARDACFSETNVGSCQRQLKFGSGAFSVIGSG